MTVGGGTDQQLCGRHDLQLPARDHVRRRRQPRRHHNPAFAASTIYNEGLIQGDNGEAIVIVGSFADTITNTGTIIGSIATDGGNDTLNLYTGSSISGLSDGGADTDTIKLPGSGQGTLATSSISRWSI